MMNFREELRDNKYEINGKEEAERVLKNVINHLKCKYFESGDFEAKFIRFKRLSGDIVAVYDGTNTDHDVNMFYHSEMNNNYKIVLSLIKEKLKDEGYEITSFTQEDFVVKIEP